MNVPEDKLAVSSMILLRKEKGASRDKEVHHLHKDTDDKQEPARQQRLTNRFAFKCKSGTVLTRRRLVSTLHLLEGMYEEKGTCNKSKNCVFLHSEIKDQRDEKRRQGNNLNLSPLPLTTREETPTQEAGGDFSQSVLLGKTENIKVNQFRMSNKDEGDAQVCDENPSPWNERHPVALLFSEREGRELWVEKIAEESRLKAWTSI